MNRAEVQEKSKDANPMNRLVPYLDLYGRLSDDELSRLAAVPTSAVANLRKQVIQVDQALARFTDLLPRLTDAELVRLTGATPKTIRFWRLCQPRFGIAGADDDWSVARAAESLGRAQTLSEPAPRPVTHSGSFEAHPTGEIERQPTGEVRRTSESGIHASAEPRVRTESGVYSTPNPRLKNDSGVYSIPERKPAESSGFGIPEARRKTTESGSSAMNEITRQHPASEPLARSTSPHEDRRATGAIPPGWSPPSPNRAGLSTPMPAVPPAIPPGIPPGLPRSSRTQEVPAAASTPPIPTGSPEHPDVRLKQQAVSQQMAFSGDPFPGYDAEASGPPREDDGIFIGLELPDPRMLAQPGRRER